METKITRQEINRRILGELIEFNNNYPDQRFSQMLINCSVSLYHERLKIDYIDYNEESIDTLKRIREEGIK